MFPTSTLKADKVTEFTRPLYTRQSYRKVISYRTNKAFYSTEPQAQLLNLPLSCCNRREESLPTLPNLSCLTTCDTSILKAPEERASADCPTACLFTAWSIKGKCRGARERNITGTSSFEPLHENIDRTCESEQTRTCCLFKQLSLDKKLSTKMCWDLHSIKN